MSTTPNRSNAIPPETHAKLLAELEGFEHLLFEPMTQADLDRLYALSERWTEPLGDSPEAIALVRCAGRLHRRGDRGCGRGQGVSGAGRQRAGSVLRGEALNGTRPVMVKNPLTIESWILVLLSCAF